MNKDDMNIDERIYQVCRNAENEYSQSHKSSQNQNIQKELSSSNNNFITSNNYISDRNDENNGQNLGGLNESFSKIAKINNKSIDPDANVLSKIKFGMKNEKNNKENNYTNIKSPFHKKSDNYAKKIAIYNLDSKDNINKTNKNSKLKKSQPEHTTHTKNSNLSKILLESRDLIKKKKLKQAYILLKQTVSTGHQHSDLFYLYGEINRMLKQNNVAENYLINALKFELHSPYVFYSLGLLYQDMKDYKNSIKFFKLFNRLLDNADVHFQIALNHFNLKDFVNAAEEISKAIDLNNDCAEYYLFRSEIYKNMGLKEMEDEDYYMYNYINRKKLEDEL
jgi:tetratricopeptide (TPR) repeat protein